MLLHFSNKEFKILDLGPPTNDVSHYSACPFGCSLALKSFYQFLKNQRDESSLQKQMSNLLWPLGAESLSDCAF